MQNFVNSIKLVRYLIVWRVNTSMVRIQGCLATEISQILGNIIANRLATKEASPWQKTLAAWNGEETVARPKRTDKQKLVLPEEPWPIEAVLFVYPGKIIYGQGENILWELELFGDSANHGLFLELILPAMEEAGYTSDTKWKKRYNLWGKFDTYAVYVAKGLNWEPLVQKGRLDLHYHPNPKQWADGLPLESNRVLNAIRWLSPFNLTKALCSEKDFGFEESHNIATNKDIPTLPDILRAFIFRVNQLIPKKRKTGGNIWEILSEEERSALQAAMEKACESSVISHRFNPPPRDYPGHWIGIQQFSSIHSSILPYLGLASILHIGKQTHFGCGTFVLE